MALGRLELGVTEPTSYTDPKTGEEVKIRFRHCSQGELAHSLVEAGLDWDEDGKLIIADTSRADGTMASVSRLEEANITLAKMCIVEPNDTSGLYARALAKIGEYLREQAVVSKEEGKPSEPPATGPTPES